MRQTACVTLIFATAGYAAGGPISKFEDRPPSEQAVSSSGMEEVERCLIDLDGVIAPMVYSQADRPDVVNLIYTGGEGVAVGRVELKRSGNGTSIRMWMPFKQATTCFVKY